MKNTFGNALAVTIFGESHGKAIGAVLDGNVAVRRDDDAVCMTFTFAEQGITVQTK